MSGLAEPVPSSGALPPVRPGGASKPQGRRPDPNTSMTRRAALPDTAPGRLQARLRHSRTVAPDIATDARAPVGNALRSEPNDAGLPQLSRPSAGYLTQILGQAAGADGPDGLQHHRDGAALGSDAYRRAGAEPGVYPTSATLFRLAV